MLDKTRLAAVSMDVWRSGSFTAAYFASHLESNVFAVKVSEMYVYVCRHGKTSEYAYVILCSRSNE
jgi:hypothetical protein